MKRHHTTAALVLAASFFTAGLTIAARERSGKTAPDGLSLSEFKGYDAWQAIAPSYTDDGVKAILGNPVMIGAYKAGFPDNGKPVPDGAMMAKIEWTAQPNPASPYTVTVPGELRSVAFMIKDARRFSASGGWGYAKFQYDSASNALKPAGNDTGCGYTCHTRVKARDFVFTSYGRR